MLGSRVIMRVNQHNKRFTDESWYSGKAKVSTQKPAKTSKNAKGRRSRSMDRVPKHQRVHQCGEPSTRTSACFIRYQGYRFATEFDDPGGPIIINEPPVALPVLQVSDYSVHSKLQSAETNQQQVVAPSCLCSSLVYRNGSTRNNVLRSDLGEMRHRPVNWFSLLLFSRNSRSRSLSRSPHSQWREANTSLRLRSCTHTVLLA